MSGWSGFSDDDLRRLQQTGSVVPSVRKTAPASRSRQQFQRERALQLAAQRHAGAPGLPPEQQLTKPPPKDERQPVAPAGPPAAKQDVQPEPIVSKPAANQDVKSEPSVGKPAANQEEAAAEERSPAMKELEAQQVEVREKTRLEKLQQDQRIIEEKNKRKKALLSKTIAEKSKQTQAEAVKLKRIQKELQALDDMVSNDIGILRGKIEEASWDFTAARKRYQKAEAEYVTAKLDLHKKTEVKEQLTEHLYAIIQQNEQRKAHKLEELMQQLQLQASEEELERQREEEEKNSRSVEMQRDEEEKNGVPENPEGTAQSTADCRPSEEDTEQPEVGGVIQPTAPTDGDFKTLENCETAAS